jgi:hypothetical protein
MTAVTDRADHSTFRTFDDVGLKTTFSDSVDYVVYLFFSG